jgi:hypothetical protein
MGSYALNLVKNALIVCAVFVVLGVGPIIVPSCLGAFSQIETNILASLASLSWCGTLRDSGFGYAANGVVLAMNGGVYGLGKVYSGLVNSPGLTFPGIGIQIYCVFSAITGRSLVMFFFQHSD